MGEWTLEFYEDENGREPVLEWLRELDDLKERACLAAMRQVLAADGIEVCRSSWGKHVQDAPGIFEFRVRYDAATTYRNLGLEVPEEAQGDAGKVLLRVFCHAHGKKVVLLLAGYDKGEEPSSKRQNREVKAAKKRLKAWKREQRLAAKRHRRHGGGK